MFNKISIVIADDHKMVIDGFKSLLEKVSEVEIVGEAYNGRELLWLLEDKLPDLILTDIEMRLMDGLTAAKVIKQKYPKVKIVFVSMHFEQSFYEEFQQLGFNGFLPKECSFEELFAAITHTMRRGDSFDITRKLLNSKRICTLMPYENIYHLSKREIEILELTCQGLSAKAISQQLSIAERTVEFHKTSIYTKTNLSGLADIISYGIKNGFGKKASMH